MAEEPRLESEELEEQESLLDYLDPIAQLGKRGWADIVEMYEGTKALVPLGKMLWELTERGETPEEQAAQEARRAEMIKGLYKDVPIEMAKDVAKLVQPEEWAEHPVHTILRAMLAKELITGLPRVGPKISATVGRAAQRGAGAAVRGLERAKILQPVGRGRIAWSELGGYSPDDIVKSFRDATSRSSYVRQYGRKKPVEAFEKVKEARRAEEMVAKAVEFTAEQKEQLKMMAKALKGVDEKSHGRLFTHWQKKYGMPIEKIKKGLKQIKGEEGAIIMGKEFRAPWEMTRAEFLSEAKGLSPDIYDDIVFAAYKRGMDIPDEVLGQFKGQFTPRPPRPGPTPKGKEPLWARGNEYVGEMTGGKYTLKRQHTTEIPRGYLSMEETLADGWVRYAGPGTFEVSELTPGTIRTMQNLIDIYTPKHGVVVDITGGGAHRGFSVPLWELEQKKNLLNVIRRNYPQLLKKPEATPGVKMGMVEGKEVPIEVVPEGVSGIKTQAVKTKGPRKTRTTQETIDLITGEEGTEIPTRTMLRKKLTEEKGGFTVGTGRSEVEARLRQVTRQLQEAIEDGETALAKRLRDTQGKLQARLEAMGPTKYTNEQLEAMAVEKIQRNKAAYKTLIAERELFLKQLKKALPDAEETAKTTRNLNDIRYANEIKNRIGRVEDDLARIKHRGLGDIKPVKE